MNEEDYDPLIDAIEDGDVAAVESFLQTPGVDVDFLFEMEEDEEIHLCTPLNWAIIYNHKAIVELLLAHGAAVNGPVGAEKTPLQEACGNDIVNEDIVKLLLAQGADVDAATDIEWRTPLTLACYSENDLGIIQLLLNAGADVNGAGGDVAPLHWAAFCGNAEALEVLIEAGAAVNRESTEALPVGSTGLHWAAYNTELTTTLLAAGADPNVANAEGRTPLHEAAQDSRASVETVNALLAAGSDPLHQDNDGRTPLQYLYHEKNRYSFNFPANKLNIITALVAAGDRSWSVCRPLALVWKQQLCLCGRLLLMNCLSFSSVWMM